MTAQLISTLYHPPKDGGPALWHLGALLTIEATASQTGGRLWAKELLAERGIQERDFLWAPRGVGHALCVESARARVLVVSTPGGFEQFFFDTGQPATVLTVPPADAAPPNPESLADERIGRSCKLMTRSPRSAASTR